MNIVKVTTEIIIFFLLSDKTIDSMQFYFDVVNVM